MATVPARQLDIVWSNRLSRKRIFVKGMYCPKSPDLK